MRVLSSRPQLGTPSHDVGRQHARVLFSRHVVRVLARCGICSIAMAPVALPMIGQAPGTADEGFGLAAWAPHGTV